MHIESMADQQQQGQQKLKKIEEEVVEDIKNIVVEQKQKHGEEEVEDVNNSVVDTGTKYLKNVHIREGSNHTIGVSYRASMVPSFKVMDVLQRANELQNIYHKDVLHCEVGQPETGAPIPVAQAAITALQSTPAPKSVMGYTDSFGLLSLRTLICQHYQKKYFHDTNNDNGETKISPNQVVITTGSSGAFLLAFTACFDVNDVVAIASSGYPCYRNILQAVGCKLVHIPVNTEFKLTAKELINEMKIRLEKQLSPIRGLILSSPSNPTGSMLSPQELQDLCIVCDKYHIQFISDEIYHGISYGSQIEATALHYSSNVIVINSFSKYYSMSGWRLGWMIIPDTYISAISSLQQNMFINAPTISQTAALQCWNDQTLKILESHVQKYKINRKIILQSLKELFKNDNTISIAPADGGFYVYIDLGENNICLSGGCDSVTFCNLLLEEHYVAITPGIDFEDPDTSLGYQRIRISYSQSTKIIIDAMTRFHLFWPKWIVRVHNAKGNINKSEMTTFILTNMDRANDK